MNVTSNTMFQSSVTIILARSCETISKRLGYVKRKATTAKLLIAPGLIKEIGLTFYNDINEIVHVHAIPAEMIINTNQTPLPFVLISKYTLEKKVVPTFLYQLYTSDYRQTTGIFAISMAGSFLPIQLIYQGKTKLCETKYNFPNEFTLHKHRITGLMKTPV